MHLPNTVIGSFVFRDDGDGCLSSKYINNHTPTPFAECAKLLPRNTGGEKFEGTYNSVWLENNGSFPAVLHIAKVSPHKYQLKWWREEALAFIGEGMLYGELLVGAYWEVRLETLVVTGDDNTSIS